MNYLGIDLHKRNAYCCLLSDSGQVIKSQRVPARRDALREFLRSIPVPVRVALEATRNWYWVFDTIEPEVERIALAHPAKTRLIAETRIRTDKVDSRIYAELDRINFLPVCYVPDQETRQKRELLRHRAFLVKMRSRLKNRIHAALDKAGVEHPFENLFTNSGIEFLKGLKLRWAYQQELNDCLELIEILNQKEKEQNRLIERLCKESPQARLLTAMPGVGCHSALLIANELAEPGRFPNGERFASYCGLVSSVHISDRTVRYGGITKQGNRWLRWVFTEAAHTARRKSLRLGNLYQRVESRSGPQKAIIAVAREMAVIAFYMLKNNTKFRDSR